MVQVLEYALYTNVRTTALRYIIVEITLASDFLVQLQQEFSFEFFR